MADPYHIDDYPSQHYTPRHYHHHSQSPYISQENEPRGLDSLEDLNEPLLLVQQMAHNRPPPHMGGAGGSGHLYGPGLSSSSSKPRARTHEALELDMSLRGDEDDQDVESHYQHIPPPHHQHPQHTHHHHMPDQPRPSKIARTDPVMGPGGSSQMGMAGPSNVPGPGMAQMPQPAPRPRGPKLKFTPEDDQLLVELKENKALTWKQIAEYFPGRSSGTLQVRYCTKLKAKTTQWTDDTVRTPIRDSRV